MCPGYLSPGLQMRDLTGDESDHVTSAACRTAHCVTFLSAGASRSPLLVCLGSNTHQTNWSQRYFKIAQLSCLQNLEKSFFSECHLGVYRSKSGKVTWHYIIFNWNSWTNTKYISKYCHRYLVTWQLNISYLLSSWAIPVVRERSAPPPP